MIIYYFYIKHRGRILTEKEVVKIPPNKIAISDMGKSLRMKTWLPQLSAGFPEEVSSSN